MVSVSEELVGILDSPNMKKIQNRSKSVDKIIRPLLDKWTMSPEALKEAPIYNELYGIYRDKCEPFDMFTFLMGSAHDGVIINLPKYRTARAVTEKEGERVISPQQRHGKIKGLSANADSHAFSLSIQDVNVAVDGKVTEELGAPRSFMVVSDRGNLYRYARMLEFKPEYLKKLKDYGFVDDKNDKRVDFEYFVHPRLALALYLPEYIEAKALSRRLKDEARFYRQLKERVEEKLPKQKAENADVWEGRSRKMTVKALQAALDLPDFRGRYPVIGVDEDGETSYFEKTRVPRDRKNLEAVLRYSKQRSDDYSHGIGKTVNAVPKAVELAFFNYGFDENNEEQKPPFYNARWVRDYKWSPTSENGKIKWNMLEIVPGDVRLLYRIHPVTVDVKKK